jgi:aromatic ring-opening dioxygenase LigB subunit
VAKFVTGMASSHAFALEDPSRWDEGRLRNRQMYERRYGILPPEQPQVAEETDEDCQTRHGRIRDGFAFLRGRLEELQPEALVFIGDDQNENFKDDNLPQVAIYLGGEFLSRARGSNTDAVRYACAPDLAEAIFTESVASDIDMASVRVLPDNVLLAHAFGPVLRAVDPEARIPVIPIFVNAIHVPAPSAARCYSYGQAIRRAVERYTGMDRVAIYASGGLSHFTGGYPWAHYNGPFSYGSISEDYDRRLIKKMEAGEISDLANITNEDIIANGEIEFRSWITMFGAIGDARPELLTYEPLYRGLMGQAVGCWNLQD